MEPKAILFLGSHGRGPYNVGNIENVESAIIQIEKRTKRIPNKNKILVVEIGGWRSGRETGELMLSKDMKKGKEIFDEVVAYYKNSIRVFKDGGDVVSHDWATMLLKFGVDNGYITVLEEINFEHPWRLFIEFEDENKVQTDRDEIFVNQLIKLMKKHPNKTLIVVRGKKHAKWMPDILKRNNITYEIIFYPEQTSVVDRWLYKLSKTLN